MGNISNLPIPFLVLSFITILCALYVVTSKNPVHSVLALILTFFSISAHYILLNAQFLAIVNLMVYAGAIMVLFLFVLMLLNLSKDSEPVKSNLWGVAAAISAGLLLVIITASFQKTGIAIMQGNAPEIGLVKNLGRVLMTEYLVPFELSGILFIAAMVGAVLLGKRDGATVQEIMDLNNESNNA
jgi:NADH-quinone oxidoreductase subunit J